MNSRISKIIVAIHNHEIILAETGASEFIRKMKSIEPNFISRETLDSKLNKNGVVMFVGKFNKIYHIYSYKNPNKS